jgi:uncharacterized membrane protein YeaQ/YmgE (transglycosylase-associated protein family)
MNITIDQIIVWLIVGGLAGALTGMVVKRDRVGFGRLKNFAVGLVGALIGGLTFTIFDINLGLGNIAITAQDLVSAFLGSLVFLIVLAIVKYVRKTKADKD